MHRPLRHRRSGPSSAPAAAIALCALTAISAAAGSPAPDTPVGLFATWGTWAALGLPNGKIVVVDVTSSQRTELQAPSSPVLAIAIVPSPSDPATGEPAPGSPDLAVASAGSGRGGCRLSILDGATGAARAGVDLSFVPTRLLPGPAGKRIYAVGIASTSLGSGRRATQRRGWTLQVIDFTAGEPKPFGVSLTSAVEGASVDPLGERIYLAERDRIRTFATDPMRSSWQLRSPGDNRAVVGFTTGIVLVARDQELARIDPSNLPGKDPVTGAPPNDDAFARLALPFPPDAISVSIDGSEAALLDEDGTRLALVDLEGWDLHEVRAVPGAAAAVFHPQRRALFVFERDGDLVEIVYAAPARPENVPGTQPETATAAAATQAPPPPVPVPAADSGENPAGAETASPAASPAEAAQGATPAMEDETVTRAGTPSEPPPEPEPGPAGPAALSGAITGEWEIVRSVVLYGPDSIVREHMRIPVGEGGRFSSPLPPPGRYRLVPVAATGVQLNVRPPFRVVKVAEEAVEGLDFDVAGKISGTLKR